MANLLQGIRQALAGKANQQAPQGQPAQGQSAQGTPMQQAAMTGLTPPNQGAQKEESVLDQLQYFMQNKGQGQEAAQTPRFQIPQEELGKIVSGQDFTKSIPQELMQRLASGDFSALPEVLNSVGRASYQAALTHSMGLTDSFVNSRFEHEQTNLQGVVDQRLTSRNLDGSIKHLHPYAQNMFKQMAADFRKQFPNASEEDIADTTWAAFKEIGGQASTDPQTLAARQQAEKAAPNWDSFGDFDASAEPAPVPQGGQGYQ